MTLNKKSRGFEAPAGDKHELFFFFRPSALGPIGAGGCRFFLRADGAESGGGDLGW